MSEPKRDSSTGEVLPRDFGHYRLVRRLGVGGMAETYEAIRRGPSGFAQRVCLKLVLPFFRSDQEFVRLFEREAKLAAKLRHRNIVGVIDFGDIDGIYYMALELVDGIDLQGLLAAQQGKRLPHEHVALIGHELALALEHAHNPPRAIDVDGFDGGAILHRDISPSNVLISRQGEVFLADFGVAKAVSGSSHKPSAVKGKIPYMPPEQLRASKCDGRADLFSLGVVLFEALGGEGPFEAGNDPATIIKILNDDHPALRGLAPSVPPGLCAVIERLIQADVDARPKGAAELIDLLEEFVPPPRTQRNLGKLVAAARPESLAASDALGEAPTEPSESPARGPGEQASGIVRAGEARELLQQKDAGAEPRADDVRLLQEYDSASPERGLPRKGDEVPARERSPTARRHSRAIFIIGFVLAIGGVIAGSTAWWVLERGGAALPGMRPHTGEEAETNRDREASGVQPATLTVIIRPWGTVWIDGEPRGRAPIENLKLEPGTYEVAASGPMPWLARTVDLRPGQHEVLEFDLSD